MIVLAVTGMKREAAIAARAGVMTIAGGGDFAGLRKSLHEVDAVDAVISIGIAGGLTPGLKPGTCIIATEVTDDPNRYYTHEVWRAAMQAKLPHAIPAVITGVTFILPTPHAKASIARQSGAIAADMESHIAGMFALERNIPFAALRVIADPLERSLPDAVQNALTSDGGIDYGAVFRSIAKKPSQIPALIRTAYDTEIAFAALLRSVKRLGPFFAALDFS